jgi:hypothetical protein
VTQSDGLKATVEKTITIAQPPVGMTTTTHSSSSGAAHWAPAPSWLTHSLQLADTATTSIGSLLEGKVATAVLEAPQASGQLVISWRVSTHHRTVVIARSKGFVLAGINANSAMTLTRAGRRLLASKRRIKVSAVAVFRSPTSASRASRDLLLTR